MTEPNDWLDEALDRLPAESAPEGFGIRLHARIQAEREQRTMFGLGRRPWALLAAAALLLLASGYWLGMGAPSITGPVQVGQAGDSAVLEISEIFAHREVLEAWELLQDPELELGFDASIAGAWAYGLDDSSAAAGADTENSR